MKDSQVLDTSQLPAAERGKAWCEWVNIAFGGLESDLYSDTTFDGSLYTSRAGQLVLTKTDASRHRVARSPNQGRRSDVGYLKVIAPLEGTATIHQFGREAVVAPGGWAIYDTTCSYEVANPQHTQHLIVMLPKDNLAERGLELPPLMGRCMGGSVGISRIALETMRLTFHELPRMTSEAARGAGDLISELISLSLLETSGRGTAVTHMEAFRDRIRYYVGQHLRDPRLNVARIAQALNCSKRHLHNAFQDQEETLAQHIVRRRLQACMVDLREPGQAALTIAEIADSWGFSSSTHFGRRFRELTSMSPSEFRAISTEEGGCSAATTEHA